MKSPLRWRILLFIAVPMAVLTLATIWVVHGTVSRRVHDSVDQDLRRAAAVFEDMLGERAGQLHITSDVIVRDPRFFSVLTLPGSHKDRVYRNTVAGVARDFNTITHADLFEVIDLAGGPVASVGRDRAPEVFRSDLVRSAAQGKAAHGVIMAGQRHFQVTATPVIAGGRVAGVLVVGARIGQDLAARLRDLTRSDVTFVSNGTLSGSTLAEEGDRAALLRALEGPETAMSGLVELDGGNGPYLTLARPLPGSRPADRQFYAVQRSLRAETAFLRSMQATLVQLGLLAFLIAIVAGLIVSERITQPLQGIVRAAEEIERGNYDFPLGVEGRSQDEIGYLARRFDMMRQRERAYVHTLEETARVKSEFIDVCSHELRTPISIIRGFQELLVDGRMGAEEQKKALQAIGEGTVVLERIADDATRVAQIESKRLVLSFDDHDVSELVKKTVRTVSEEAVGRSIHVTLETERNLPLLRVDETRLGEAIAHLVRNAFRFTPDGGRVDVRTGWRDGGLEIEVADDGIGIPKEEHERIFELGVALRDSLHHHSSATLAFRSSGLGLGLTIARGNIEAHGGTITVESEPGKGSRFLVRIRPEAGEAYREAA